MRALRDEPGPWPVTGTEDLHRGEWVLALRTDQVKRPDDGEDDPSFTRYVVELPGAVMILPVEVDEAGVEQVVLLRQYRHPVGARLVELPAGLLDVPGEDPVVAAQRELREETELEAAHWRHLVTVYPSPGISTETHAIFLATGLGPTDRGDFVLEHEEADMVVERVPMGDLLEAVLRGDLRDAPLVTAVLAYDVLRRRGELSHE